MEPGSRLVRLTTVVGSFHAKVLVARLASEGIRAQALNGIDGPYPLPVEITILVPEAELALASEVLLADAVDAAFIAPERPSYQPRWRLLRRLRGR